MGLPNEVAERIEGGLLLVLLLSSRANGLSRANGRLGIVLFDGVSGPLVTIVGGGCCCGGCCEDAK